MISKGRPRQAPRFFCFQEQVGKGARLGKTRKSLREQPRLMLALVRGSEKNSKGLKEAAAAVCLLQQVAIEEHLLVNMRNRGIEE